MTKEEKAVLIDELKEKFASYNYFYFMDAGGMTVAQVNKFRRMCFEKGLEYKVIKNSLIKKALENLDTDYTNFNQQVLKGFSGVIFSADSPNAPAKLIKDFYKAGNVLPALKGASIDSSLFVGKEQLDTLNKLKSKMEMLGELMGLLQSPGSRLVSALQSGGGKLAGVLKTLSEKKDEAN